MKHICFVVNKYPTTVEPYMLIFLQQLAWSMADLGKKVSVICPLPVNIIPRYLSHESYYVEKTSKGASIDVYFPKTIGFGQSHYIFGRSPVSLTVRYMESAAEKIIEKMDPKPDVIYGHFLAPSGITAVRLGNKFNIPSFFAYGESHDTIAQFGLERAKKELENICGVIAVSSFLKKQLTDKNIVPESKIGVFPNGYRDDRFKPYDRVEARKKFNFPIEDTIAGFVGGFNERKGILRVEKAVDRTENVKFICAGAGKLQPHSKRCLFAKPLDPKEIPCFNSAADFFVLPTLLEGCSNAVVEAMACGLPVISSNLPFNDDILDPSCSIRVDPTSIDEIYEAVSVLSKDEDLRQKLSHGALEKAKALTLDVRAKNIINFIEQKISESCYAN